MSQDDSSRLIYLSANQRLPELRLPIQATSFFSSASARAWCSWVMPSRLNTVRWVSNVFHLLRLVSASCRREGELSTDISPESLRRCESSGGKRIATMASRRCMSSRYCLCSASSSSSRCHSMTWEELSNLLHPGDFRSQEHTGRRPGRTALYGDRADGRTWWRYDQRRCQIEPRVHVVVLFLDNLTLSVAMVRTGMIVQLLHAGTI